MNPLLGSIQICHKQTPSTAIGRLVVSSDNSLTLSERVIRHTVLVAGDKGVPIPNEAPTSVEVHCTFPRGSASNKLVPGNVVVDLPDGSMLRGALHANGRDLLVSHTHHYAPRSEFVTTVRLSTNLRENVLPPVPESAADLAEPLQQQAAHAALPTIQ